MTTPKIKICGLTNPEEAKFINEAKVDYAGFVFFEKSKRNINIETAREIFKELDNSVRKVAVMVSPSAEDIIEKQTNGFDILQVHGELKEEVLKTATLPVWYAINIQDEEEASQKLEVLNVMDEELIQKIEAVVVDAPVYGSGKPFNWQKSKRMLKAGTLSPPLFVLAGGLNKDNVIEGINIFNPDVVDVSSGVERDVSSKAEKDVTAKTENSEKKAKTNTPPGKDEKKILDFVGAVRKGDR